MNNFATSELEKYLTLITKNGQYDILLTVDSNLFVSTRKTNFNTKIDDAYKISIKKAKGSIIGVNERSVLLGVYRFLYFIGCRFLSPTEEIIPSLTKDNINIEKDEIPFTRYRGIVIEGAVSKEHVLSMIDYLPKNGFNSYFIQLKDGNEFFRRWYQKEHSNDFKEDTFDKGLSELYTKSIEQEIKKRFLMYHKVGHGWTSQVLNKEDSGWTTDQENVVDKEIEPLIAQIDGSRKFYHNQPINTSLCFSNNLAREKVIDNVSSYCKANPQIDFLHLWLADGVNNRCECEKCQKHILSDWYLILLNELDARMTKENISTKIVFIAYVDLLQPAKNIKIINESRFIFMFAPISRTYLSSYLDEYEQAEDELSKYSVSPTNKFKFYTGIKSNLAYLKGWRKVFGGESIIFDYHLMWEQYKDFSGLPLSQVLYKDIKSFDKIGIDGLLSCQSQRVAVPHNFNNFLMGQMLINPNNSYVELFDDYFSHTCNQKNYLEILEVLANKNIFQYLRAELPYDYKDVQKEFQKTYDFLSNINIKTDNVYFQRLLDYIIVIKEIYKSFINKINGDSISELKSDYNLRVKPAIFNLEDKYQELFDGFECSEIVMAVLFSEWKVLEVNFG